MHSCRVSWPRRCFRRRSVCSSCRCSDVYHRWITSSWTNVCEIVISTRTDVLPTEYTNILKTLLQDDVPGFSGKRAKEIVSKELGKPCGQVFKDFSPEPLAAASLGQVHTATYKGKKVAIKCKGQDWRSYLMWMDLKNLKKLAELLGKFEPKSMELIEIEYQSLYEESERLLSWSNSAAKDSGLEGSIIFIERRHIAAAASSAKMEVVSGWVQHVHDVVLWLWWVLSSGLRRGRRWPQHITIYYHNWPS